MNAIVSGLGDTSGYVLFLNILPGNFGAGFAERFGGQTFTFITNVSQPLPRRKGEHILLANCGVITVAQVCAVRRTPPELRREHPFAVYARVTADVKVDIATMEHLMYRKRWSWITASGRPCSVFDA